MLDQLLPSLVTLTLLLCMFLWALLIDFLIHMQKRGSPPLRDTRFERRKNCLPATLSKASSMQSQLPDSTNFQDLR